MAYEKIIALRDKVILALGKNSDLLQEKVALLENTLNARKDNTESHMREVELEFMHEENDRVRQEATIENARLSTELETLKKEITASQERIECERKELAREKDRNNSLSEKLTSATLVSERTMLAYGTQENILKAKQEMIDRLKEEIEGIVQPTKTTTSCTHREVETMTSNTDPTSESADMVPRSKMLEIAEHYDAKIKVMNDDLEAKDEIIRKTDIALQAKEDLLDSNNETISNLKVIIGSMENEKNTNVDVETNQTSNRDSQKNEPFETAPTEDAKNGVKETCEFIKIHAINGVIINPFLLWADIQRKMHPENKWKEEAARNFVKTEITEAKEMLWRIAGEEHLGKMVRRQGTGKCTSEVSDICLALRKLSEKDKLPLFVCTSGMVASTPICGTSNLTGDSALLDNYLHKINDTIADTLSKVTENLHAHQESLQDTPSAVSTRQLNVDLGETIAVTNVEDNAENETRWSRRNQRWKHEKPPTANQTDLVISKVKLDVVGLQIRQHFANKDVEVDECRLMTTRDDATFLTYRVRVKKNDAEKLKDPSFWPNGTEIRPYKPAKMRKSVKGGTAEDKGSRTTIGNGSSRSGNATSMRTQLDTQRGNAQATNYDNSQDMNSSQGNHMMSDTTRLLAPQLFTYTYPGFVSPGIAQQYVPARNNSLDSCEKQLSALSGTHSVDMNGNQGQRTTQRRFPLPGISGSPVYRGVTVKVGTYKFLLLNTYFPTDQNADYDENDLLVMLSDIEKVLDNNEFDDVVWTGDINADFKKKTKHVKIVDEFIKKWNALKSWDDFQVDFTHVTEREGSTYTSTIDHFFWNQGFRQHVEDAGVLNVPENMSDHSPVYCKFSLPDSEKTESIAPGVKRKIPSWKKATDYERLSFTSELETRLKAIDLPMNALRCRNVKWNDHIHKAQIDDLLSQLLSAFEDTASETILQKAAKVGKQKIPEWKEDVAPFKDNAHFWHSVWISAGKPLSCTLHTIMNKSRNRYHLVLRKMKRIIERMKRNNLLESCVNNNGNIFDDIKRMRRCHQSPATAIDDISDDIPGYMAYRYEALYNSVDDESNIVELEKDVKVRITAESLVYVYRITIDVVKESTMKLKPAKTDPLLNITSDYLMNSPDVFFQILTACLKSYMIHGHVSDFLLISMMIPIIKDKLGDHTSSDNYRSIAISSVIMKVFDTVILTVFEEYLKLDDLQFGYQREVSTTMCTWLAAEIVSHFLQNGSEVFSCLMDMSKVFDRVQHSHLFQKLLIQGMPPIIVCFILASNIYQKANVNWNGANSEYFQIGNGVKQGAILSAVLYCVYTNGLFEELRRSKIGCRLGRHYVGVLGYGDDLFLIAPSVDGLQQMLKICERYANDHNFKFSTDVNPHNSKTKCMAFLSKSRELRKLKLCGNELPWVEKGKYQ